jgi:hypothetical protein
MYAYDKAESKKKTTTGNKDRKNSFLCSRQVKNEKADEVKIFDRDDLYKYHHIVYCYLSCLKKKKGQIYTILRLSLLLNSCMLPDLVTKALSVAHFGYMDGPVHGPLQLRTKPEGDDARSP